MLKMTRHAIFPLLLSGGTALAQTNTAPPAAADTAKCALPAIAASAELNQVSGSQLVTVPVEIDGKPKQFLLAVSANASEVSQAAVKELKLVEGLKRTETFFNGTAQRLRAYSILNE